MVNAKQGNRFIDDADELIAAVLFVPQEFRDRFKAACVATKRTYGDVAIECVSPWIEKVEEAEAAQHHRRAA